jgi:hypothetical protein
MKFTSDGTDGPRFDQDEYGLDLGNNVGGFLPTAVSAPDAARAFYAAGWRVRKSSWTGFEVEHTYAQLELFTETPVRFRGVVVPERLHELLSTFSALGLSYIVELEGPDGGETVYRS